MRSGAIVTLRLVVGEPLVDVPPARSSSSCSRSPFSYVLGRVLRTREKYITAKAASSTPPTIKIKVVTIAHSHRLDEPNRKHLQLGRCLSRHLRGESSCIRLSTMTSPPRRRRSPLPNLRQKAPADTTRIAPVAGQFRDQRQRPSRTPFVDGPMRIPRAKKLRARRTRGERSCERGCF